MITIDMIEFDRFLINCGGVGGTPGPCPARRSGKTKKYKPLPEASELAKLKIPIAKRVDQVPVAKRVGDIPVAKLVPPSARLGKKLGPRTGFKSKDEDRFREAASRTDRKAARADRADAKRQISEKHKPGDVYDDPKFGKVRVTKDGSIEPVAEKKKAKHGKGFKSAGWKKLGVRNSNWQSFTEAAF